MFHVQDQCVRLLTQELQHGVAGLAAVSIAPSAGGAGAGGAGPSTPARDAPPQSSVAVRSPGSTPSLSPLGVSGAGSPAPVVEAGATLSWEWVEQQLVDVGANTPPACGHRCCMSVFVFMPTAVRCSLPVANLSVHCPASPWKYNQCISATLPVMDACMQSPQ